MNCAISGLQAAMADVMQNLGSVGTCFAGDTGFHVETANAVGIKRMSIETIEVGDQLGMVFISPDRVLPPGQAAIWESAKREMDTAPVRWTLATVRKAIKPRLKALLEAHGFVSVKLSTKSQFNAECVRMTEVGTLIDVDAVAEFAERLFRPSLEQLMQKLRAELSLSEDALLAKALEKMRQPAAGCFVAGTLVHTKEGLVPIEQLKTGDWVLSAPESGEGDQAYKRVMMTMVRHGQPTMQSVYKTGNKPDRDKARFARLTSTYDHPFWTEEEGWMAARMPGGSYIGPSRLRLADGSGVDRECSTYIYCTPEPDIGWVAENGEEGEGWLWDYATGKLAERDVYFQWEKWESATDEGVPVPFKTTVYNIEVEDYHTYFVGEHGVWVHNANRGAPLPGSKAR